MAKAAAKPEIVKAEAAEEETSAPKKKRGKLPLIIGLVVVLAGGGGGAFYFLKGGSAEPTAPDVAEAVETANEPLKPPVFVPLENFTVNLVAESGEQYLQLAATLKVLDPKVSDAVKQYMPEIRHRILLWLAAKRPSEINTPAGRERLSEELRVIANNILLVAAGKPQRPMLTEAEPPAEEAPAEPTEEAPAENTDKPKEIGATPATPAAAPAPAAPAAPDTAAPAKVAPAENTLVVKAAADDPIQSVFFTSFIIQ